MLNLLSFVAFLNECLRLRLPSVWQTNYSDVSIEMRNCIQIVRNANKTVTLCTMQAATQINHVMFPNSS